MTSPPRRSRRGTSHKKYTIDPFAGIKSLLIVSSDSGSDTSEDQLSGDEDEFDHQQAAIAEAEEKAADEDEVVSDDQSIQTPEGRQSETDDDGQSDIAQADNDVNFGKPETQLPNKRRIIGIDMSEIHQLPAFDERGAKPEYGNIMRHPRRGVPDIAHTLTKESRVIYAFGPGTEDLAAHIKGREKWLNQPTLPTRKADKKNAGGLAYSALHTKQKRKKETDQGWQWYYEQGCRDAFLSQQESYFLDTKESRLLHLRSLSRCDPFLIGPSRGPKLMHGLEPCASTSTTSAWSEGSSYDKRRAKNAWILNTGSRVQCLDWVPNQSGLCQYLAAATAVSNATSTDENDKPNAYTSSASYQMGLQLWEFAALDSSSDAGCEIDFSKPPILRFVIAFDWGVIKRLRWCPVPDRERDSESEKTTIRLGLLAGVWADGRVRVLDLEFPRVEGDTAQYIHISSAIFESKAPNTMYTGITWLSSSSLAASCSDGYVAVWNIADYIKKKLQPNRVGPSKSETSYSAQPWFYQPFHQSYITSITSAYPSRPHFLLTRSMDGYNRMTDLRSPNQDNVLSSRDRVAQPPLLWHDATQTAISTDENYDLKACALRLWHKSQTVGRVSALVTDMASSLVHPFVMMGCADGSVWCTNPMKRLRDHKSSVYQQIWFKHEWRRGLPQSLESSQAEDSTKQDALTGEEQPQHNGSPPPSTKQAETPARESTAAKNIDILAKPLIRFTEGYKLQRPELSQRTRLTATKEDVSFVTVYEEKTAITQVSWNPNLNCGTWGAAGMASGLVRVEDLALD